MKQLVFLGLLFCCTRVAAQLNLPERSPAASVSLDFGYTTCKVHYHSPAVLNRTIFGGIVPYNEIWRAGANWATTVSFDRRVKIGTTEVQPDTYALFLVPRAKGDWIWILNRQHRQWGAFQYDSTQDVVRIAVQPTRALAKQERLRFLLEPRNTTQGVIMLEWEEVHVELLFEVFTVQETLERYEAAIKTAKAEDTWWMKAATAEALVYYGGDAARALQLAAESCKEKQQVYNYRIHARVLAYNQQYKEARKVLDQCATLSKVSDDEKGLYEFYLPEMEEWRKQWK